MTIGRHDVERFASAIVARLGFRVDQHNEDRVDEILRACLRRTGCTSVDEYAARFGERAFAARELREIAAELTVPETYFFRHPEHFDALREVVVPHVTTMRQTSRQLTVLSAGCATGEEAYSIAAVLADAPRLHGWSVRVLAIDLNETLLERARRGSYSRWSLRGVSDADRARHFTREGNRYVLDARLRSGVAFESRNLLDDDPAFWRPDGFDVVFCRNVMLYLSGDATRALVERLAASLVPGGFLFLGPSETLRGVSQAFHLRHTHGAFYYQRRLPQVSPGAAPPMLAAEEVARGVEMTRTPDQGDSGWMSAIIAATARIAALQERARRPRDETAHPLDEARALLRQERFDDALRAIGSLPDDAGTDPDALLLEAVLLANSGNLSRAEEICGALLASNELRPGAHYLLAFCQERRGDYLSAAEHDQIAIYLDPAFAMPHLHLGLLARRLGDLGTARRELLEAQVLLGREDASRILLFGGGFDRAALTRFCEAQLDRCGGIRS
jgi:chemotaxis protein methyltransferase CheR